MRETNNQSKKGDMMKYASLILVLLIFLQIIPLNIVFAEEKEKVIIISEEVGEVIDAEERERYGLWPTIKGFKSAIFLQLHDGSYFAEVTFEENGKEKKDRSPQSENSIASLKYYIENYEEKEIASKLDSDYQKSLIFRGERDRIWLNGGIGASSYGVSPGLSFSVQIGYHVFSGRLNLHAQFFETGSFKEYAFLYGIGTKRKTLSQSIAVGFGYVSGEYGNWPFEEINNAGLAVESQIFYIPTHFLGIGLYGFGNLNKELSFGGVQLCLRIGKLR